MYNGFIESTNAENIMKTVVITSLESGNQHVIYDVKGVHGGNCIEYICPILEATSFYHVDGGIEVIDSIIDARSSKPNHNAPR